MPTHTDPVQPVAPDTAPFCHDTRDGLDVLVIGAGQAGLAIAYHLKEAGLRFLVADAAAEVGSAWRNRWDSLTLFTPAQYDALPGMTFPSPADTYPTAAEVADYLQTYATRFELPILLNTAVTRLARDGAGFAVHTTTGLLRARQVVVATGPFQTPVAPAIREALGRGVQQMHSAEYRNPDQVGPGQVLVVGAGNSGRQIALELAASHEVTLAVGTEALQLPQRMFGRDLFWWLLKSRLLTKSADTRVARRMRARGDLVIGSPLEDLREAGVDIRPRLIAANDDEVTFADGSRSLPATVVWATGFRPDYSWIDIPDVVTEQGVDHERGITPVQGLTFIGLPWQHTRGSALLGFVRHDAAWLARRIIAAANHRGDAEQPGDFAGASASSAAGR
ncbi:SidA/IucD/PvdA family monooxygenase [Nocardioides sp. MAH-18]|uniref:SidA/IucD/PvdA family monooxygenase n=1 Tax=Nocardioides agri TaxID=2682843 RepID=A0A6L6XUZ1_9ACTN|nr:MULTISPECIES: NAD(P)/FAD-dependent oxidoreductase [unclassified Nocardioides]MBA2956165.1 NAD(P)-binding domain-containing protein [Nocardioides sp. CGMCC 1.13656]MVQ51010.1 SidA/IucD/PvdA family monooxygenase [Nocardioides sp. MAH-18]